MNFEIKQSSKKDPTLDNYWNWAVWIEGDPEDLDKVREVEYILHPTFPNRVRVKTTRRNKFRLSSKGWGEFNIRIKIHLKDESDIIYMNHYLELFDEETDRGSESVFISAPFQNKEEAQELATELTEANLEVRSQDDIDPGMSLVGAVADSINDSDTVIIFNPGELSSSQQFELNIAKQGNKQIFIIDEHGNYKSESPEEQVFLSKDEALDAVIINMKKRPFKK